MLIFQNTAIAGCFSLMLGSVKYVALATQHTKRWSKIRLFCKCSEETGGKVCVMAIVKMLIEDYKLLKGFKIWCVFAISLKKTRCLLTFLEIFSYLCGQKREDQHCFKELYLSINRIDGIFLVQTLDGSHHGATLWRKCGDEGL